MQKIITLFEHDTRLGYPRVVIDKVSPGAEWVIAGVGVATRKFDGTCVKIDAGRLFKRYDLKSSGLRRLQPPPGWTPAQPEPDPATSSWPGWLEVNRFEYGPEDAWFIEAFGWWRRTMVGSDPPDGTYELCGPKVQGNPERFIQHHLIPHGAWLLQDVPRDFASLRTYFDGRDIEGVVWHWLQANGTTRMVKIKARDFGFVMRPAG